MALFVKQNENRTELQQRIAAELQQKSANKARDDGRPDGVDDSQYLKNTKTTTSLAWVWGLVFLGVIALVIWLIVRSA
jgi:hypothetical protein